MGAGSTAVGNGVGPRADVAVGIGAELDEVGVGALEGSTATGTPVGVCAGLGAVVGVGTGLEAGPVPGSSQATANAATARAVPRIRQRKVRQRVMDMSVQSSPRAMARLVFSVPVMPDSVQYILPAATSRASAVLQPGLRPRSRLGWRAGSCSILY